ncbi:MAG: hypothetical protein ACOCRO_07380 [Halanaerobiales bacterium]
MHDGVGAALGTAFAWFGMLGFAVITKPVIDWIKEKCSPAAKDKRVRKNSNNNYNISWRELH